MNIKETLTYIKKHIGEPPQICLILGSGLHQIKKKITQQYSLPYKDIPNFYDTSIEGHKGEFIFGYIDNKPILCASGRFHYYEGYTFEQVGSLIEIFNELNPKLTIITNSSGCLNLDWELGSFMLIEKFLDFSFIHSKNVTKYKVKKMDYYSNILNMANEINVTLYEGTYTFTTGPSYETDSEVKEIIKNGGNAVGMSTFPEFLKSEALNLNSLFISCLTNYGAGLTNGKINHKDVLKNANKAKNDFCRLIIKIIENI